MLLRGGLLVGIVFAAYVPAINAEFVWDDETNITNNATLRSIDGLRQMWLEPRSVQQYYPLMYTSYWLEHQLWGFTPAGYHVTNIFLHAAAAILVWRLLARLSVPGAWMAGAIFAVHPVEVESVAWVTERKNVLSLSFALLSIGCYLRFSPPENDRDLDAQATADHWRWYGLAFGLFVLALFAKTVVVTLPAVLLVVYWWKRGRITWRDVVPLVPFFALSVSFGLLTASLEVEHVGAQGEQWSLSPIERFLLAGRALWFYASKLLWPHPLALFYPRWTIDAGLWWQYLFPTAALALLVTLWLLRDKIGRGPLAAALVFSGVLVPALGFFNVYFTQYSQVSDHFQYHASVALIALAAAGATLVVNLYPRRQLVARCCAGALLTLLAVLTFRQTYIFHDLETLYRDTIAKNPQGWIAYLNLSTYLDSVGRDEDALKVVRTGLQVKPDEPRMHASIGNVLGKLAEQNHDPQQRQEAFEHYTRAAQLNPQYGDAFRCLGFMSLKENPSEAQAYFVHALKIQPRDAQSLYGIGAVAGLRGDWASAEQRFEQSLTLDPSFVDARCDLAMALARQSKTVEAIQQCQLALQLDPRRADTHFELANLLIARNDLASAIRHYHEAVQIRPSYVEALQNLGAALLTIGDADRAIDYFNEVLRLEPGNAQAQGNLEQARTFKQRQGGKLSTDGSLPTAGQ
jgi:protein O-mannosyl-transferase